MKLIYKLIAGFLLVASLSWIIGFFSLKHSKETLEKTFVGSAEATAQEIASGIQDILLENINSYTEYSQNILTQETVSRSNKEFDTFDDIQAYIVQQDEEWRTSQKKEITPFMETLISNDLSQDLRNKTAFYERKAGYKVHGEVFVTNRHGANVALTGKTSDYRQDDEAWWISTVKDGVFISDVHYDESAELYSLDLGIRIDDKDGNFIGAMKVVMNFESIIVFIQERKPAGIHKNHRTMNYSVIDRQGRLLYSTDEYVFLEDMSHILPPDYLLDQHEHPVISSKIIHSEAGEAVNALITHVHIKGTEELPLPEWFLIAEHGSDELFASVSVLKNKILITSAFITIISLVIGFAVSLPIVKNVKKLMSATSRIGKGDFDVRIAVNSKDEIGRLAQSIQQMEKELKLSKAQLVQSEKLSSLGQLSASLAHELSSPVQGLTSLVKVQKTRAKEKDSKEYQNLSLMLKSCQHMAKIINDFSLFARQSDAAFEEIDANTIVKDALTLASGILKQKKIDVITEYASSLHQLRGNRTELQQVALNIIMNAVDAMDSNGRLQIRTGLKKNGTIIIMEFQDNGRGIQDKELDKIFDPFYTTKGPGKGVGLGLSVSYGIIQRHGGEIQAESTAGKGSRFTVLLPAAGV